MLSSLTSSPTLLFSPVFRILLPGNVSSVELRPPRLEREFSLPPADPVSYIYGESSESRHLFPCTTASMLWCSKAALWILWSETLSLLSLSLKSLMVPRPPVPVIIHLVGNRQLMPIIPAELAWIPPFRWIAFSNNQLLVGKSGSHFSVDIICAIAALTIRLTATAIGISRR
ncbi:hypothetical protein KC345_g23 [Hortaea werneckii]|nr:hypothetical protein KC345_g23 [Hortaea werneckii]